MNKNDLKAKTGDDEEAGKTLEKIDPKAGLEDGAKSEMEKGVLALMGEEKGDN